MSIVLSCRRSSSVVIYSRHWSSTVVIGHPQSSSTVIVRCLLSLSVIIQLSSVVIQCHPQSSSVVHSCCPSPTVIVCRHRSSSSSVVIYSHPQSSSIVIHSRHPQSSSIIYRHRPQSSVVRCHHQSSVVRSCPHRRLVAVGQPMGHDPLALMVKNPLQYTCMDCVTYKTFLCMKNQSLSQHHQHENYHAPWPTSSRLKLSCFGLSRVRRHECCEFHWCGIVYLNPALSCDRDWARAVTVIT